MGTEFISNSVTVPVTWPTWFEGDQISADYRYFVADLLSNNVLAELPLTNVSFSRAIKGAGTFTGSLPVIVELDNIDAYTATMPGKMALYVTRNGICVWGGIIWSRSYDLTTKTLQINGNEFISYFYHRNIWKTWSNEIGATITKVGTTTTALLEYGVVHDFGIGSSVRLEFREVDNWVYNGYYNVISWDGMDNLVLDAPYLPVGTYALTTIFVRTDTYDFVRSLIDSTMVDFIGIAFANDEIEAARGIDQRVIYYSVSSGEVTIKTQQPHNAMAGQAISVRNIEDDINGEAMITQIVNEVTFRYIATGAPDVALTYTPVRSATVVNKQIYDYTATLTTSAAHNFQVGDVVVVTGVDDGSTAAEYYNGTFQVTATPTATTFQYTTFSVVDRPSTAVSGGNASVSPFATIGTYGPYPLSSDVFIEYATAQYSGQNQDPTIYRGFEVRSLGEELDKYTDTLNAFEYRIDCIYDEALGIFRRIFYMIPLDFPDPPATGDVSPIARFGADKLVFTYPGNIMDIQIDESSENAATRFFMVGNIPDLGNDISQPYAVATATDLLAQGWPLLDAEEQNQDIEDEEELYKYAQRYLSESRPPIADIKVSVNGSMVPYVGNYRPGEWCSLVIDDPFVQQRLASDLEPRDTVLVRKIDQWKVDVPDFPAFPEKVELTLIAEWQVDKRGE